MDNTVLMFPKDKLACLLQDQLCEVLRRELFEDMTISHIVGVLEFLKFNLINCSD